MRARTALMVLLALGALALQVQPATQTVNGGIGTSFNQVFTVVNNEPRPLTITIEPDPYSLYLSGAATLSEQSFVLKPQESQNVQVRGVVPTLGPEVHKLIYHVRSDAGDDQTFTVRIPIAGTPVLQPKVTVTTNDVVASQAVEAKATLFNFGNVIAYYNLTLTVKDQSGVLGTVRYPRAVQVLPGDQKDITLLYTDALDPGNYVLRVDGEVNGVQNVSDTAPFRVILADQNKSVSVGSDLILHIKRYQNTTTVAYTISQGSDVLIQDTIVSDSDTLTIPTHSLSPGDYQVTVRVIHGGGADTTRIGLAVHQKSPFNAWYVLIVVAIGIIGSLFTSPVRLRVRILLLYWRIGRREKQLNRLLARAHALSR